jgi:Holliday junction resolvase RusA-like endonuclease
MTRLVSDFQFDIPIHGPGGLNAGTKDPYSNRYAPTKERPRFSISSSGRVYTRTSDRTKIAERMIQTAWRRAGACFLGQDKPIEVDITVCLRRPGSHTLSSGALSASGKRFPHPYATKPDLDNAAKLVMDALNQHAWKDDVQIVRMSVTKRWIKRREISRVIVSARTVDVVDCQVFLLSWETGTGSVAPMR